jgi:DNA end-binding protein Ku
MAGTKKRTRSKRKETRPRSLPVHAFWSGSLSFGLVNVPVLLFPASRHAGVRLRLMSQQGRLLERQFYCPHDAKVVASDEIVRGYELDDGSYVIVQDSELDSLEPRRTREIELREFVMVSEISPAFLQRGYYLTPLKEATTAYRLLAEVMEQTQRAGIATFVMRDREYLVAIFAQKGILCAESLRFPDELRDPSGIGLPHVISAPRRRIAAFERSVEALSAATLTRADLPDPDTSRLRSLIEAKKRAGEDVVRVAETVEDGDLDESRVDLLEMIRKSLRHTGNKHFRRATAAAPSRSATRPRKKSHARKSHARKAMASHAGED